MPPPRAPVWTVLNKADAIRPVRAPGARRCAPRRPLHLRPAPARASMRCSPIWRAAPAGEPVPLSRRRDQHRRRCASSSPSWCAKRRSSSSTRRCPTAWPARSRSSARPRSPVYIRAVLYVERESQKRILIGATGSASAISGATRAGKIEAFVGAAGLSRPLGEGASRTGERATAPCAASATGSTTTPPHDALSAAAGHPRLPEVQGHRSSTVKRNRRSSVAHCRLRYPVRDDIPIMLIDEATPL